MLPTVIDLSGLCCLGDPVWCCQREDAWDAGKQLWLCEAGRDSANHFSPWPETLNRLCHQGVLQRLEDRRGKSAFRSCEQHLTRMLLPCSSSSCPNQQLNPCCSFSVFHFVRLAVLPTPQPETLHTLSGFPSSKSGLGPGASSELRDTSTSWLPPSRHP